MSIKAGNEHFKNRNYTLAIEEYKKVDKTSPLFTQALFNIEKTETLLGNKKIAPINSAKHTNKPLISVIMPVFNVAPYLDASILSILHQSYQNIELIIVNDASTDNSLDVIHMYAGLDDRIRVIDLEYNTLGGAGIPSNFGITAAKGEYIGFVDSDDWVAHDAFEAMYSIAEQTNAEVVIADFCNFDQESRALESAYDKANWNGLPIGQAFSPEEYPSVFRLSPVPWRKLYKRDFMQKNKILFPEGDYFYEDNPLHWFVLSSAEKVVLLDKATSYHRMAREGQTMGASSFKLSAQLSHINTVKAHLEKRKHQTPESFWLEFVDLSYRAAWIISKQEDTKIKALIQKRYAQSCHNALTASQVELEKVLKLRPAFASRMKEYSAVMQDTDLTVVVPIYNCEDFIQDTLDSLKKLKNIKFDVLLMDDGSTDATVEICERFCTSNPNFYLFTQKNRGAGRARNAVIPLITGTYSYFLDADDTFDASALEEAVRFAEKNQHDLLLFKYNINFYEEQKTRGMFDADQKIFEKILNAKSQRERAKAASALINYPWNRIIKTQLLHDENIFFGPTIVHNDIPYHWHSIVASKNIGIFEKPVCTHRKFSARSQITNINDSRRMMVFEALRHTLSAVSRYEAFNDIRPEWSKFSKDLLKWAEGRIPAELNESFQTKKEIFIKSL